MALYIRDYIPQIEAWAGKYGFGNTVTSGHFHTRHGKVPADAIDMWIDLMARMEYPEKVFYKGNSSWIDVKLAPFSNTYTEQEITLFADNSGIKSLLNAIEFYNANVDNIKLRNIIHEARKFLSGDLSPDERRSYIEFPIGTERREPDHPEPPEHRAIRY